MEPDRFADVRLDEQRAVIAVNEEYRKLQDHVPRVVGEPARGRPIRWILVLLVVLVAAAALGWWLLR